MFATSLDQDNGFQGKDAANAVKCDSSCGRARVAASLRRSILLSWRRGHPLSEIVLESPRHRLKILHAACARATAALCLLAPIVGPHFLGWVTTTCALLLLVVKCPFPAPRTETM